MASTKSQKLEDQGTLRLREAHTQIARIQAKDSQAATAALYVTRGKDNKSVTKPSKSSKYPLDEDNKLSSAGERMLYLLFSQGAFD